MPCNPRTSPILTAQLCLEHPLALPACTSVLFRNKSPDFMSFECKGVDEWPRRDFRLKSQVSMWSWPFPYGGALATTSQRCQGTQQKGSLCDIHLLSIILDPTCNVCQSQVHLLSVTSVSSCAQAKLQGRGSLLGELQSQRQH